MCGIAGIVGRFEQNVAETNVRKMTSALARRGPDSEGIECWDSAVLGHRRLAIFDLSEAGHQPMLSKDRSLGVVFNGAIYNYPALRKQLISQGHSFSSNTDTEVLVHGYEVWGIDGLVSRLHGMFAFALWDDTNKKLYLVRDRLGVKPLVFSQRDGSIAFASNVRALKVGGYVSEIDDSAVLDFLNFGFVPDERSIYRNASKLPAATILEWSNGFIKQWKYWTPPTANIQSRLSFNDALEETERLLLQAVELRLHADVPVGVLLSGGVDSSLICWAVTKLGGDITAYTVGVRDDPWDESPEAIATAQVLGIRHRVLKMSDEDNLATHELLSAYAEPFACASALGMLAVSRAVAPAAKVLLTGDGGDDVFLGYPRHRHLWLAENISNLTPSMVTSLWLRSRSFFPRKGLLGRAASLFDYVVGGLNAFRANSDRVQLYKAQRLLGERLLSLPIDSHDSPWPVDAHGQLLERYLEYERHHRFVGEYMTKVDGATMHHGLEARSPFLDQTLWEFASSLPIGLRLRQFRLKAILRELARRNINEHVANGTKKGFGIPVQRWMVGRWRPFVESTLHDSILSKEGWMRSEPALLQLSIAAKNGWAPEHLWYFFVLELWLKHERFEAVQ